MSERIEQLERDLDHEAREHQVTHARWMALLERVTVLEQGVENAIAMLEAVPRTPESWVERARKLLREALDA